MHGLCIGLTEMEKDHLKILGAPCMWQEVKAHWPEIGDACLLGAALLLHALRMRSAFQQRDLCRQLLLETALAGASGEHLQRVSVHKDVESHACAG